MKILVIGAGQIGSRHLQGLAACAAVTDVVAVEPHEESRLRAESRWRDVPGHADKSLVMVTEPPQAGDFAAAIVATSANGRLRHLETASRLGIRHVLAEKLLFQSQRDLDAGAALATRTGMAIYSNYVYRYAAPWGALRQRLAGAPFRMTVTAGDIGLGANLPHWLDLFEYLASATLSDLEVTALHSTYPSKRGGDFQDCSGRVAGRTTSGSTLDLDFAEGQSAPRCRIDTDAGWIVLNETDGTLEGPLADSGWQLETPMVSRITAQAIPEILAGRTPLPNLHETLPMNRLLLNALGRAMLGSVDADTIVPVT